MGCNCGLKAKANTVKQVTKRVSSTRKRPIVSKTTRRVIRRSGQ